jgi:NADH:ubiquinone oxidoreductase subunit 2 (subunit N)
MDLSAVIGGLLPEVILLIGGCVVLLAGSAGAARDDAPGGGGGLTGPLAFVAVLAALGVTVMMSPPTGKQALVPGILITPLTHYVRLGGLFVGLLIIFCNLHVPTGRERAEYFSMLLFSLLGLLITAAANDLLVLFFAIELVSVPTYVLISLSREDRRLPKPPSSTSSWARSPRPSCSMGSVFSTAHWAGRRRWSGSGRALRRWLPALRH